MFQSHLSMKRWLTVTAAVVLAVGLAARASASVEIQSVTSCFEHDRTVRCLPIGKGGGPTVYDNIEPRMQQGVPLELRVDCDGDVDAATVSVDCGTSGYGGTATVVADGSDLVWVEFSEVLPNKSCCELTFQGDIVDSWAIVILECDVDFDREVTTADKSAIVARFGDPLTNENFYFDVNNDGQISTADASSTEARFRDIAPACP